MDREFRLTPPGSGRGVSCDANGDFLGSIPLLKRSEADSDWEPRDCAELSEQISTEFGLPIDMTSKIGGLNTISRALNEDDIARAQIATVLLGIPDSPESTDDRTSDNECVDFVRKLNLSGLIKADWNSDEHPRWAAGAPESQGGQFAPKGEGEGGESDADTDTDIHPDGSLRPATYTANDSVQLESAAYPGDYHDAIVETLADYLKSKGLKVETEMPLQMIGGGQGARMDIMAQLPASKYTFCVEVKTGPESVYKINQQLVYGHLMLGGSVTSTSPRIARFGFAPLAPLPPIFIFQAYSEWFGDGPHFTPLKPKDMLPFLKRIKIDLKVEDKQSVMQ